MTRKRYLLASDFDQTLSFNDSGLILSQMIGASRESANKLLRDWQRRSLLKLKRGGLILTNPKALAAMVSEPA